MASPEKINYGREFMLTFSTRKSLFSSKKIERFVVFTIMLALTVVYLILNLKTISSIDFIEVIGLWLFYGGYTIFMGHREALKAKKQDEHEPTE